MKKENLHEISAIQYILTSEQIGERAVRMFQQGYTLRTISKRLCESHKDFTKEDIRRIIGKHLTEFIKKENQCI